MPKKIVIPAANDLWDERNQTFISCKEQTLVIEHSLLSVHKWERKWKKPFLTENGAYMTPEEVLDYIKCMTINNVDDGVYMRLTEQNINDIRDYISDPMTASTFNDFGGPKSREAITAEVVYYLMIKYGIWKECEKWPLGSLIALIKTCEVKGGGGKKMSRNEAAQFQRALNEKRLAKKGR